MQLSAKLLQILPVQSGTGKNGPWQKHTLIVEALDQYHNQICLTIWGDQIDISKIKIGDQLTFNYFIQSKEYNGKWYTNIIATEFETEADMPTEYEIPDELCKEIYDYFKDLLANAATFGEKIKINKMVINKFNEKFKKETSEELNGSVITEIINYFEKGNSKQNVIEVFVSEDANNTTLKIIDVVEDTVFQDYLDKWLTVYDMKPISPATMVNGISIDLVSKYQSLNIYHIDDVILFTTEKLKTEKIEDVKLLEYIESFHKVGIDDKKDKDAITSHGSTTESVTTGNTFLTSADPSKLVPDSLEKLGVKLRPLHPGKIQEGDFL